ncbi:ATP-binding cassette domain-containing protein, partial [Cribrihabitans pelagius]|uniref:ATP-binding cassette domain-containing protein n=1 Tax=Cribrihabitans pelagius TaxID=1765746 RepID=UPI003B58D2C3
KKGSRRAICASVSQKRSDMVTARFRAVNHADSRKSMGPDPRDVSAKGLLSFAKERLLAVQGGARLRLKYGKVSDPAASLSGGNQQKVVLAKWLASQPEILLLDEPTRGVDVGAKAEIYAILKDLAAQGMSMIVVSSELPELITLSDRMLVMSDHKIQGSLMPEDFQQETILKMAYGQLETPKGQDH